MSTLSHDPLPRSGRSTLGSPGAPVRDELSVADPETAPREFACGVCVTNLRPGDVVRLRRMTGVTEVIDDAHCADVHLILAARSPRAARLESVARVTRAVAHAAVKVHDVVDYDAALLKYLDRHGDELVEPWACFDDCAAVAVALDRC